ncbi:hypothetical protein BT63DRAFT_429311 [Microthyrium microscopicum]|uniref:Uncharacterized protein n=1 Tax=Microthyrium microscopicum TaxID=703497 RepID=A0A6A6TZ01_9PEZI|nr:hypothetical protein BT63DRAFT_429311 [Microthyrium microscopicum]
MEEKQADHEVTDTAITNNVASPVDPETSRPRPQSKASEHSLVNLANLLNHDIPIQRPQSLNRKSWSTPDLAFALPESYLLGSSIARNRKVRAQSSSTLPKIEPRIPDPVPPNRSFLKGVRSVLRMRNPSFRTTQPTIPEEKPDTVEWYNQSPFQQTTVQGKRVSSVIYFSPAPKATPPPPSTHRELIFIGANGAASFYQLVSSPDFKMRKVRSLTIVIDGNNWSSTQDADWTAGLAPFASPARHRLRRLVVLISGNTLFTKRSLRIGAGQLTYERMKYDVGIGKCWPYWQALYARCGTRADWLAAPMQPGTVKNFVVAAVARIKKVPIVVVGGAVESAVKDTWMASCVKKRWGKKVEEGIPAWAKGVGVIDVGEQRLEKGGMNELVRVDRSGTTAPWDDWRASMATWEEVEMDKLRDINLGWKVIKGNGRYVVGREDEL